MSQPGAVHQQTVQFNPPPKETCHRENNHGVEQHHNLGFCRYPGRFAFYSMPLFEHVWPMNVEVSGLDHGVDLVTNLIAFHGSLWHKFSHPFRHHLG